MFIKDESLQSYVFRKLIVAGNEDFEPLVTKAGQWRRKIFLTKEHQKIFSDVPETILLGVTEAYISNFLDKSTYSNPLYFLNIYKNIFLVDHHSVPSKQKCFFNDSRFSFLRISYCRKCIKESIIQHGFGYLRTNWIFSTTCITHGEDLLFLPNLGYKKAVAALKDILSGKEIASSYKLQWNPIKSVVGCIKVSFFNTPISPCTYQLVVNKIRNLLRKERTGALPENQVLVDIASYLKEQMTYKNGPYKNFPADVIDTALFYLAKNNLLEFIDFDETKVEEIPVTTGLQTPNAYSTVLTCAVNRECRKCTHTVKTCAASPHIEVFQHPNDFSFNKKNYCDIKQHNVRNRKNEEFVPFDRKLNTQASEWLIRDKKFIKSIESTLV